MARFLRLLTAALFVGALAITGCDTEEGPGEQMEEAIEETGEAVEEGAEETGEAAEEAAEETDETMEEMGDEMEEEE